MVFSTRYAQVNVNFKLEAIGTASKTIGVEYSYEAADTVLVSNIAKQTVRTIFPSLPYTKLCYLPTSQTAGSVIDDVTASNVNTPSGVVFKGQWTNLVAVNVLVPAGYYGDLTFTLRNSHAASGVAVDFCGLQLVSSGSNMPCLLLHEIVYDNKIDPRTLPSGRIFYGATRAKVPSLCYVHGDFRNCDAGSSRINR